MALASNTVPGTSMADLGVSITKTVGSTSEVYEATLSGVAIHMGPHQWVTLAIGFVVSFLVAWAVVAWFIGYLQRRGLLHFGIYRIALGLLVLFVLSR